MTVIVFDIRRLFETSKMASILEKQRFVCDECKYSTYIKSFTSQTTFLLIIFCIHFRHNIPDLNLRVRVLRKIIDETYALHSHAPQN